jgi:hypothetical protein
MGPSPKTKNPRQGTETILIVPVVSIETRTPKTKNPRQESVAEYRQAKTSAAKLDSAGWYGIIEVLTT